MAARPRAVNAAHTAGIFADMTLDGPEIGTLVAVVDRARNLPNRKTMGKQDPYCAMRLGKEAKKTNTDKRGGQTPKWDQELRFTVHDSPDYYRLKCSVFNDDKKTDLIGEAWIDLREVIVPGGGQNDLWHQLNFKGKYAGDVRVELTYYDTRPLPDLSSEKKRQRSKTHSTASDAPSTASTSRQLGPREIKRRPLPPGPGGYTSATSATQSPEPWPTDDPPAGMWTNPEYTNSHPPPRPPKQRMPETPDDVGYGSAAEYEPDAYSLPLPQATRRERLFSHDYHNDTERMDQQYHDLNPCPTNPYAPDDKRSIRKSLSRQPDHSHSRSLPDISIPDSQRNVPYKSEYHSSPPARTSPPLNPTQIQQWQSRSSTSPTKHTVYQDSPLRQSISHVDVPQSDVMSHDPRFDEDERPPPPPAHRDHISRAPAARASYPVSHGLPSPQTPLRYSSVEDRSPLQRLEREYSPYQGSSLPDQRYPKPAAPAQPYDQRPAECDDPGLLIDDRGASHNDGLTQLRPNSAANETPLPGYASDRGVLQQQYKGSPQQDIRQSEGYGPPRRAHTFDASFQAYDDHQMQNSEPAIRRPRAVSPGFPQSIPRKSITPTPAIPENRNPISAVPYGPDSYDVLNPGTSPTVDGSHYVGPEQLKEAARQREVEKLRDQGPIIGNDGRVIDPSDHLPADTWAPEPERKNRMPEHVVRIRTKEEARLQNRAGSSPASIGSHAIATSPYQPSPPTAVSNSYQSPPTLAAPSTTSFTEESSGRRNRLRKQMPVRPLPSQPSPHTQSSPAVMPASSYGDRSSPSSQRYTISSSPSVPVPQRPALSEYQIPVTNNYSPQDPSAFADSYSTPTKAPVPPPRNSADRVGHDLQSSNRGQFPGAENPMEYRGYRSKQTLNQAPLAGPRHSMDHGGYATGDSLAMELSTIDIGPSRTGRTALRPVRGYGGY